MKRVTKATIVGAIISSMILFSPMRKAEAKDVIIVQIIHEDIFNYVYDEGESGGIKDVLVEHEVSPYYIVRKGESIKSIATILNITEEYLLSANIGFPLSIEEEIPQGVYIELPDIYWQELENVYLIVSKGDTLSQIAGTFYTNVEKICDLNSQIEDPNLIYTGSIIKIR